MWRGQSWLGDKRKRSLHLPQLFDFSFRHVTFQHWWSINRLWPLMPQLSCVCVPEPVCALFSGEGCIRNTINTEPNSTSDCDNIIISMSSDWATAEWKYSTSLTFVPWWKDSLGIRLIYNCDMCNRAPLNVLNNYNILQYINSLQAYETLKPQYVTFLRYNNRFIIILLIHGLVYLM